MPEQNNFADSRIYIIGGTIIDGTGREPLPDGAICIEKNVLQQVSPRKTMQISHGSRVIEADGKTILPGLIDCHVHLIYSGYPSLLEIDRESLEMATLKAMHNSATLLKAGFTTVRDCGTRGRASLAVRDAVNQGLTQGPRIFSSGQIISTTAGLADPHPAWIPCHVALGQVVDGPWDMAKAIRQQIKSGVDLVKLAGSAAEATPYSSTWMSGITAEELQVAVSVTHDYGRRVAFHGQALESTKSALLAGIDTLEHGTRLDEEAIALLKRKNITLVPTLTTLYSVLEYPEPQRLLPKQVQEMEVNKNLWLNSLKNAHDAGVRIAVGSDIGNRKPQGANALELYYLVNSGLSPMDAIVAATKHGAEAIGLNSIGTLEPNKLADLIIVDGDPISDISVLQDTQHLTVMKEGLFIESDVVNGRRP